MPTESKILSAHVQDGYVCIWAIVHSERTIKKEVEILLLGTGQAIPDDVAIENFEFLNTVFQSQYVWHVFKKLGC